VLDSRGPLHRRSSTLTSGFSGTVPQRPDQRVWSAS
jgi:hypothetical protein